MGRFGMRSGSSLHEAVHLNDTFNVSLNNILIDIKINTR